MCCASPSRSRSTASANAIRGLTTSTASRTASTPKATTSASRCCATHSAASRVADYSAPLPAWCEGQMNGDNSDVQELSGHLRADATRYYGKYRGSVIDNEDPLKLGR